MEKKSPENLTNIDYKDIKTLQRFLTSQFKVTSRKRTGLSAQNQRKVAKAVKLARQMAFLPYTREQRRKTYELSHKIRES